MKKLCIFDLDGTLLDTVPDIAYYVNQTMKKFGFPEHDEKAIKSFVGNGARNLIVKSVGEGVSATVIDECLDYYNKIYTASDSERTKLFFGIDELLRTLKKENFLLAILTNKPQFTTDKVYEKHLKQYGFDMVVGSGNGVKCKPDKTAAVNIMEKLDCTPKNTFLIGDGETDVLTALNAAVRGVAVLWGYRNRAQLTAAGAKVFATNPKELYEILKSDKIMKR